MNTDLWIYAVGGIIIYITGMISGQTIAKELSEEEMFRRLVDIRTKRKLDEKTGEALNRQLEEAADVAAR